MDNLTYTLLIRLLGGADGEGFCVYLWEPNYHPRLDDRFSKTSLEWPITAETELSLWDTLDALLGLAESR